MRIWTADCARAGLAITSTLVRARDGTGMRSEVFLAAMMPAMRAVANTSPCGADHQDQRQGLGAMVTKASARASRSVTCLSVTSTMGLAALVEMGQVHLCTYRKIRWMIRVYSRDHRWVTSCTAGYGHRADPG